MRLLLAEDDELIGTGLSQRLKDNAYAIDWVKDGLSALAAIDTHQYSLLLLDLGLPKRDGFTVLKQLRSKNHSLPIIIITARDDIDERIKGLDLGADDYLTKPFDIGELLARIRAVNRRQQDATPTVMSNGILELDPASHRIKRDGIEHELTAREFSLIQALLRRPGAILSRDNLESQLYGWNEEVESNVIEFIIHSLRKKLGSDAIKNVRGVGWMVDKRP